MTVSWQGRSSEFAVEEFRLAENTLLASGYAWQG